MKIQISKNYDFASSTPYCRIELFGRTDEEYLNGAEDLTYNFWFRLPDAMTALRRQPVSTDFLGEVIQFIENGVNEMFAMYEKDLKTAPIMDRESFKVRLTEADNVIE